MSAPFTAGPFRPEAMFAGAAAGFYELLKAFAAPGPGTAGGTLDCNSLARALGAQFEQWLKSSQVPGPALWGSVPPAGPAGIAPEFAAGFAPGFPPGLPFGSPPEARATWDLLVRFAQLQGQLGAQWAGIASGCAQRFAARAGAAGIAGARIAALTPERALELYELWVDCAEEAYAERVRTEEFASLQAQLTNTTAELLLAQRRQAEQLARAWGLPTRAELEGLERRLRELRAQLEPGRRRGAPRPKPRAEPRPASRPRAARRPARRRGRRPRA